MYCKLDFKYLLLSLLLQHSATVQSATMKQQVCHILFDGFSDDSVMVKLLLH